MKYLKYKHQSIFPCGGGSNLILGTGMESQIFILRTPATVKFFLNRIVKKLLWHNSTDTDPPLNSCYRS